MGNIKLKNKIIVAPMAGITNLAFRLLCKDYGAALVFTEMISATAFIRKNEKTAKLVQTANEEKPVGLQLFGENAEEMIKAAKALESNFDLIDVNMGCPIKKIMENGGGAALLGDKKAYSIISGLASSCRKPISAKIRLYKNAEETVRIARKIEEAGASMITVHPRKAKQFYSGKMDMNVIAEVKKNLSIPVVGNGDIRAEEDAARMLETTGCDYVMIGRKAIGNPYFIKQCVHYLKTGEKLKDQSTKERADDFLRYLKLTKKHKMRDSSLKHQAHNFTLGLSSSTQIRTKINSLKDREEITKFFRELSSHQE